MTRARAARWVVLLVLCLLATACGGTSGDRPVTVLASWTGAEETAFRSVLADFTAQTGIAVSYQGTRVLDDVLDTDVRSGRPPDVAILFSAGQLADYARAGDLVPLRDVLGDLPADYTPGWRRIGEIGRPDVYAVPVKANLKNLVWYPRDRFSGEPPRRVTPLVEWAADARRAGRAPWCLGMGSPPTYGWPGTDWVEDLLLQQAGSATYRTWASGRLPWTSPAVRTAWSTWGRIVGVDEAGSSVSDAALFNDFDDAAKPMFRGGSGCLLDHQASFALQVYSGFDRSPAPGRDFDFVRITADSGAAPVPIVSADLAAMFTDTAEARQLMRFLAGPRGQSVWPAIPRSGAFSANTKVDPGVYPDAVSRRIADVVTGSGPVCYDASDTMPVEMTAAFERAVLEYLAFPDRLGSILDRLEQVRAGLGGDQWLDFQCTS